MEPSYQSSHRMGPSLAVPISPSKQVGLEKSYEQELSSIVYKPQSSPLYFFLPFSVKKLISYVIHLIYLYSSPAHSSLLTRIPDTPKSSPCPRLHPSFGELPLALQGIDIASPFPRPWIYFLRINPLLLGVGAQQVYMVVIMRCRVTTRS